MANTLKERHVSRRLKSLGNRLVEADQRILHERQVERRLIVLVEAMSEEDLTKVSGVIDKLRAVQAGAQASGALGDVIDRALMDLQKITGGEETLGQKFLSLISQGDNAKVFKNAMGLVSALETGFRLMPQLLKNMIGPVKGGSDQAGKTVADLLMGEGLLRERGEAELGDPRIETKPVTGAEADKTSKGSDKMELLVKNISKAMKPSKWWGLASGKIPYIDDPDALVTDILNSVPVGNLMQVVQTISSGPQASNLAQDVAGPGTGGETQGSEGTQQTSVAQAAAGTEKSQASNEPRATPPGAAAASKTKAPSRTGVSQEWIADFSGYLEKKTGVDRGSIDKIMSVLAANGKLHESGARVLRPAAAIGLLHALAKSGGLQEAVEGGTIVLRVRQSDIDELISK